MLVDFVTLIIHRPRVNNHRLVVMGTAQAAWPLHCTIGSKMTGYGKAWPIQH